MSYQNILVVGNAVDGFEFYGPFDTEEDATSFADREVELDWVVARLWPGESDE